MSEEAKGTFTRFYPPSEDKLLLSALGGMRAAAAQGRIYFPAWEGREEVFMSRRRVKVNTGPPPEAGEADRELIAPLYRPLADLPSQAVACARAGLDVERPVAFVGPDLWLPAAVLAAAGGRALLQLTSIDQVEELSATMEARSLALVCLPVQLPVGCAARLTSGGQRAGSAPGMPVGLVTGRDEAHLYDLVLKTLLYNHRPAPARSLFVYWEGARDVLLPPALDGRLRVLSGENCRRAALEEECRAREMASFSVIGHGREDGVVAGDFILCGRRLKDCASGSGTAPPGAAGGHRLPACAGGGECFRQRREPFPASMVPARLTLVNSCCTWTVTGGAFDVDYSLTLALLDGACAAFVSSPLMAEGKPYQNVLFHHLADEGAAAGEIVTALNEAVAAGGADHPTLLLAGDPELRVAAPRATVAESLESSSDEDVPRVEIATAGRARTVIRVSGLPDAAGPTVVEAVSPARFDRPITCLVRERETGRAELDLFSLYPLPETVTLAVWRRDPVVELGAGVIGPAVAGLECLDRMGIRLQKVERLVADIRAQSQAAVKDGADYRFRPEVCTQLLRRLRRLTARLDQAEEQVMDWFLEGTSGRRLHFNEFYRPMYRVLRSGPGPSACPYCGGETLAYVFGHRLYDGDRRWLLSCACCGPLEDLPAEDHPRIRFQGPDRLPRRGRRQQRLTVTNPARRRRRVLVGCCFHEGARRRLKCGADRHRLNIPPLGEARIETPLEAEDAWPHHYFLRVYTICDGAVGCFSRSMWVTGGEAAGD